MKIWISQVPEIFPYHDYSWNTSCHGIRYSTEGILEKENEVAVSSPLNELTSHQQNTGKLQVIHLILQKFGHKQPIPCQLKCPIKKTDRPQESHKHGLIPSRPLTAEPVSTRTWPASHRGFRLPSHLVFWVHQTNTHGLFYAGDANGTHFKKVEA